MRLEELILSMGEERATLHFHERLTVLGGIPADARAMLVDAICAGLAGGGDDTELSAVDLYGRRMRFAHGQVTSPDGAPATPVIGSLVDDRETLHRLMVLTATDLGLPAGRPSPMEQAELTATRTAWTELRSELAAAQAREVDPAFRAELATLEARLRDADEAELRAEHHRAVVDLAARRDELDAVLGLERGAERDAALVAAADEWRALDERSAAARDTVERGRASLRAAAGLLAQPALGLHGAGGGEPEGFTEAAKAYQAASTRLARLNAALSAHVANDHVQDLDRRIPLLAPLDQDELWATHRRLFEAEEAFAEAARAADDAADTIPADIEAAIDDAHVERVRSEELAADRWKPGMLGASVLAIAGLMIAPISTAISAVLLLATFAVVGLLVVHPRMRLARAHRAERAELARVGADSYLGLQLRRLDGDDPEERKRIEKVAGERTRAWVAWKELAGHLDPADAVGIEDEVRHHALRFNATLRAKREAEIRAEMSAAADQKTAAAAAFKVLVDRLEALVAEQEVVAAHAAEAAAATLVTLGVDPSGHDTAEAVARVRLDASRREQARAAARPRAEVAAELASLEAKVSDLARPGWEGEPPPPLAPEKTRLLRRRHDELASRIAEVEEAPAILQRRFEAVAKKVHDLEVRMGEANGSGDAEVLVKKLLTRLARARSLGADAEESLPVLLDEPIIRVAVDRRCDLLDMVLRVSERMQIVLLTEDPVALAWAHQRAEAAELGLFEPTAEPA